jgi:hypothetical protein
MWKPEIHPSDQGIKYTSALHVQLLGQAYVRISTAEVGRALQNGFAERVIRTITEAEVGLQEGKPQENTGSRHGSSTLPISGLRYDGGAGSYHSATVR